MPLSECMTAARLNSLSRCMNAVQTFFKTVIAIPDGSIHYLAFPSWSAWCYVCIIACKLVFLGDEREHQTEITETFTEVLRVVMDQSLHKEPRHCSLPLHTATSTWNPIAVAKEAEVLATFQQTYRKLRILLPEKPDADKHDHCRVHPLSRIAYFQRSYLVNFIKRLDDYIRRTDGLKRNDDSSSQLAVAIPRDGWTAPQTTYTRERRERAPMPLVHGLHHINSIDFDSIAPPENTTPPDVSFSDWLWSTTVDDFAIPPPL